MLRMLVAVAVIGGAFVLYVGSLYPSNRETCATVDPILNVARWTDGAGRTHVVTYRDEGERIAYAEPVPSIVRELTENRAGTAVRKGCDS